MTDLNPSRTGFKRVMLKLGGEMFGGGKVGIDPDVVESVARVFAGWDGAEAARARSVTHFNAWHAQARTTAQEVAA